MRCQVVRPQLSSRRFFFFFQAEDGIRDFHVTGVQTCALPICGTALRVLVGLETGRAVPRDMVADARQAILRSEERRVGKECRSRWPPEHEKKIMPPWHHGGTQRNTSRLQTKQDP